MLADRLLTFASFIPAMVWLMASPGNAAAVETAETWARMNHLRHALVAGAWLSALQTLSWLRWRAGG